MSQNSYIMERGKFTKLHTLGYCLVKDMFGKLFLWPVQHFSPFVLKRSRENPAFDIYFNGISFLT